MAVEIVMPKLGWTAEEATITEWTKKDGELVQRGEVYLLVEGDKSVNEIESFETAILRLLPDGPKVGETVKIGTLLGYFVQPGEKPPFEAAQVAAQLGGQAEPQASPSEAAAAPSANPDPYAGRDKRGPKISPRALRIANELGVDWQKLTGSGTSGRIVEADVQAAAAAMAATAAAKVAVVQAPPVQPVAAPAIVPAPTQPVVRATPVASNATRKTIAARMSQSAHTTAPVTLTTEVDASELFKLRETLKGEGAGRGAAQLVPSYNDLFAKLVALALQDHPALNASWSDEGVIQHAHINIGMAVQTERGLLVPVVRDPARKSLPDIAAEANRLVEQARNATLSGDDMRGGTFTITNLGMYDIDGFTPVINLPECAILGIGRMVAKVVVVDEANPRRAARTAIRKMMVLSLTFDHRVVDGAPAAQFLQRVKKFVEQPYIWLVR